MRPYLAVLRDSFREALASRVLVILLALIAVFLLALALLSVREEKARTLTRREIHDDGKFLTLLSQGADETATPAARSLHARLSERTQSRLAEFAATNTEGRARRHLLDDVLAEINAALERPDLFPPELVAEAGGSEELAALAARPRGSLTQAENGRLNRLLLGELLPRAVSPPPPTTLSMYWAGWRWADSLPFPAEQFPKVVEGVLASVTNLLAGIFGVFIAILVTASIIPHTFEPGAIDLLLSKPVSRTLLFLTKFLGGCAFTLLNAGLLVAGLWLIAGLRFDFWNHRLLLTLPVFLFLFAIYYSVSAMAGVIWRNAIVSVGVTVIFWLMCFTVGTTKVVVENFFLNSRRLAVIVPAGDDVIVTNKAGESFRWKKESREWEPIFHGTGRRHRPFDLRYPLFGPAYDPVHDQLVAIERPTSRFGGAGKLLAGPRAEGWKRLQNVDAPAGTAAMLLTPAGDVIAVTRDGLFQFTGDPAVEHKPLTLFGIDLLPGAGPAAFENIGPASPGWHGQLAADISPDGNRIVVLHGDRLQSLRRTPHGDDEAATARYEVVASVNFDSRRDAVVAVSNTRVVAAFDDGAIQVHDADTLQELATLTPFPEVPPRSITVSPDGHCFAIVTHHRHVWMYDARLGEEFSPQVNNQGEITAAAFTADGRQLLLAEGFGRVSGYFLERIVPSFGLSGGYHLAPFLPSDNYAPPPDTLEVVYRYLIDPVYTVFPKPGEMDSLVAYLLTGEQTVTFGNDEPGLDSEHAVIDIWRPLWSNLAFLAVMLTAACVYVARRDF